MPSYVRLPEGDPPYPAMLDFLDARFPNVGREVWRERLRSGKISTERGEIVTEATAYRPSLLLRYFREVAEEPPVPFDARILFQNEHLLIACKPHFLPVTPAGAFVNHCLLYHLTQTTGLRELAPAVWITGLREVQNPGRAGLDIVAPDPNFDAVKVNPLLLLGLACFV